MKSLIGSKIFWVNALALVAMVFGSNELKAILPSDSNATEIIVGVLAVVNIVLRVISSGGTISSILPKK